MVTGGAGFIGSHFSERLAKEGHSVVCIDNFNDYYDPNAKRRNIALLLKSKNFSLYENDILEFEKLKKIFEKEKPEIIVHLAASVGVRNSITNPSMYADINVKGTINVLEASRLFGAKKLIFSSSSSVYGKNKKIPFSESDPVDNPASVYAVTKRTGELLCKAYHDLYGIDCMCLRFFSVYGPRGRPDMAPYKFTSLINQNKQIEMYGDGSSGRDYTYVGDIINGLMKAVEKNFSFDTVNLGNSGIVKLMELISLIESLLGKKAIIKNCPAKEEEAHTTYADISKAKKILSFNPKTGIREGMSDFVEWFKTI